MLYLLPEAMKTPVQSRSYVDWSILEPVDIGQLNAIRLQLGCDHASTRGSQVNCDHHP